MQHRIERKKPSHTRLLAYLGSTRLKSWRPTAKDEDKADTNDNLEFCWLKLITDVYILALARKSMVMNYLCIKPNRSYEPDRVVPVSNENRIRSTHSVWLAFASNGYQ